MKLQTNENVQNKPIVIQDVILNICYASLITAASTHSIWIVISGVGLISIFVGRGRTKILGMRAKLKGTFFRVVNKF